jgi:predicted enzyme related to lactoylglutathione lyase
MTMADEKLLMVTMSVTDMAKAKAFYAEQLGWSVTQDYGEGDRHWVTLSLPGGGAALTLSTMHGKLKPGTMTLYLSTSNIEATYNELKAKGAEVNAPTRPGSRSELIRRLETDWSIGAKLDHARRRADGLATSASSAQRAV